MFNRLVRLTQIAFITTVLVAPARAQTPDAKLDESLRESVQRGCTGMQKVIIRTKPGYRASLRDALAAHGDVVLGEFPALDAVAANVHCDDLTALAGFVSTDSVSLNGPVAVQALGLAPVLSSAQNAVAAARTVLLAAKADAKAAQQAVREAEKVAAVANAHVATARKALAAANRLTGLAKTTAVAAAQVKLSAAQTVAQNAQNVLEAARTAATLKNAAALDAQDTLVEAKQAQADAAAAVASRDREGRAAKDLKRKFFATMPVHASQMASDDDLDSETGDYTAFDVTAPSAGGANIGVAVIDSGIEPGTDFDGRISAFYDFTQGDIRAVTPLDPYGHGTHVAGLVASEFVGVAPHARLIGLRVLDDKGQGVTANVVRAIEFAIANKDLLGIHVLNLSLGHPIYEPAATDPLVQAVEHAVREGLVVVASAGNFGMNRQTGAARLCRDRVTGKLALSRDGWGGAHLQHRDPRG